MLCMYTATVHFAAHGRPQIRLILHQNTWLFVSLKLPPCSLLTHPNYKIDRPILAV